MLWGELMDKRLIENRVEVSGTLIHQASEGFEEAAAGARSIPQSNWRGMRWWVAALLLLCLSGGLFPSPQYLSGPFLPFVARFPCPTLALAAVFNFEIDAGPAGTGSLGGGGASDSWPRDPSGADGGLLKDVGEVFRKLSDEQRRDLIKAVMGASGEDRWEDRVPPILAVLAVARRENVVSYLDSHPSCSFGAACGQLCSQTGDSSSPLPTQLLLLA